MSIDYKSADSYVKIQRKGANENSFVTISNGAAVYYGDTIKVTIGNLPKTLSTKNSFEQYVETNYLQISLVEEDSNGNTSTLSVLLTRTNVSNIRNTSYTVTLDNTNTSIQNNYSRTFAALVAQEAKLNIAFGFVASVTNETKAKFLAFVKALLQGTAVVGAIAALVGGEILIGLLSALTENDSISSSAINTQQLNTQNATDEELSNAVERYDAYACSRTHPVYFSYTREFTPTITFRNLWGGRNAGVVKNGTGGANLSGKNFVRHETADDTNNDTTNNNKGGILRSQLKCSINANNYVNAAGASTITLNQIGIKGWRIKIGGEEIYSDLTHKRTSGYSNVIYRTEDDLGTVQSSSEENGVSTIILKNNAAKSIEAGDTVYINGTAYATTANVTTNSTNVFIATTDTIAANARVTVDKWIDIPIVSSAKIEVEVVDLAGSGDTDKEGFSFSQTVKDGNNNDLNITCYKIDDFIYGSAADLTISRCKADGSEDTTDPTQNTSIKLGKTGNLTTDFKITYSNKSTVAVEAEIRKYGDTQSNFLNTYVLDETITENNSSKGTITGKWERVCPNSTDTGRNNFETGTGYYIIVTMTDCYGYKQQFTRTAGATTAPNFATVFEAVGGDAETTSVREFNVKWLSRFDGGIQAVKMAKVGNNYDIISSIKEVTKKLKPGFYYTDEATDSNVYLSLNDSVQLPRTVAQGRDYNIYVLVIGSTENAAVVIIGADGVKYYLLSSADSQGSVIWTWTSI